VIWLTRTFYALSEIFTCVRVADEIGDIMISRTLHKKIKDSLTAIAYEKIILFGSRARGDFTMQSDFDLLVIIKNVASMHTKINLTTQLRKCFAMQMLDADVLVKDEKDVDYLKDKPGSVVRNALREGVVL